MGGDVLLSKIDLLMPLSPDLGWGKHTSGTTHVTESSLTGTVGSTSRDTRNTCNGTTYCVSALSSNSSPTTSILCIICNMGKLTSSPRLSGSLMTGLLAHGIWLTLVLGHSSVNGLNDIWADGGCEDLYPFDQLQFNPISLFFSIPNPRSPFCIPQSQFQSPRYNVFFLLGASSLQEFSGAYLWQRMSRTSGLALGGQDGDGRSRSHREVGDGGRCRFVVVEMGGIILKFDKLAVYFRCAGKRIFVELVRTVR